MTPKRIAIASVLLLAALIPPGAYVYETVRAAREVARLRRQLETGSPAERAAAVYELERQFRGDATREAAETALADPDPEVRFAALGALINCGSPEQAEAVRPLLADPLEHVRYRAARAWAGLSKQRSGEVPADDPAVEFGMLVDRAYAGDGKAFHRLFDGFRRLQGNTARVALARDLFALLAPHYETYGHGRLTDADLARRAPELFRWGRDRLSAEEFASLQTTAEAQYRPVVYIDKIRSCYDWLGGTSVPAAADR